MLILKKYDMQGIHQYIQSLFHSDIRANLRYEPSEGSLCELPQNLNANLIKGLRQQNIHQLYAHQSEAFNSISKNQHTLLVSSTASGKTLSFFLPVFNEYVQASSPFSTLLLYPTKALSRDQENTFGNLMHFVEKANKLGTFDGDTPREERHRIQKSADFIITNPDMLHGGILPNHNRRWKSFLSRLRYIIIDEVHTYRGAFGSHVSNVFRRLDRICKIHGSQPVYICSSATIGNPLSHVRALFHHDFNLIAKDGAPRPGRHFYFINPPVYQSHGYTQYRKGPKAVSVPILREAVKQGIRTICFCRSRQEVERVYRAVTDGYPDLKNKIKPYRGGLLPNERRQLEHDLVNKKITGIISTNALELGIDIGDLELCLLSGHPGSLASFWQQAGRVGRKGNDSITVYIAKDNPIDQYLVHHPEFISQTPVEQAWLNADNPYIVLQHLPCMAYEYPLRAIEPEIDKLLYDESLKLLIDQKCVVPYRNNYRYALKDYPAKGVNLRGMTDYNVEIFCGSEVIGEIDPIGARGELYKDAVYQHLGKRYISMELDLDKKLCRVEPIEVDYFTDAHWESRIEMTRTEEKLSISGTQLVMGEININRQPKLYKKIKERTYENIGYGPITLPPFEYDTTGFCFIPPRQWVTTLEQIDKRQIGSALYGLSYIIKKASPYLCMADTNDIDTDVALIDEENQRWKSAMFLFDTIEGGVGYSEKIFENFIPCLEMCRTILKECECQAGCPACIPPIPPGINNEDLVDYMIESNASVACANSLITALIDNKIEIPEIKRIKLDISNPVTQPPPNLEKINMQKKLGKAAGMLTKKRERTH